MVLPQARGVKRTEHAWGRRSVVAAAAIGAAVLAPALGVAANTLGRDGVETSKYEVLSTHEGFEVRRYDAVVVAEVDVEGTGREASSAGFRLLADYIFGNNTTAVEVAMTAPVERRSEKIAMTAPVDRRASGTQWTITFTMPSKYTLETLPKPNNAKVRVRNRPARQYAVSRFSGAPSERVVQERMTELADAVAAEGLKTSGLPPTYSRYDPPWTPFFLRRNEIMIELLTPTEPR